MKIIRQLSRMLIGTVFLFSGFVKAIDPLGTAYKIHDYFHAFNLTFFNSFSLALSLLLCTTEFIGGFSVITGIRQKTGTVLVAILLFIFTPVTLVLAFTNPVSDCGCFGDALHLTNWQTFWKNVVLLIAILILILNRENAKYLFRRSTEWILIIAAAAAFLLFAFYNLRYLPVIDFLPYKTGVRISEKMVIPAGALPDIYETTFIYEKNGIRKEFSLKDYPSGDSSWKFIDQKSIVVKKGYKPSIHDFSITAQDGSDLTQKILESPGYSLFMITKKFREAPEKRLLDGFELGRFCHDKGIDFYVLTASGSDESGRYGNGITICSTDETTLKTMIRSNPGYMLIKNGTIIGKWSYAGCPDKEWFEGLIK